MVKSMSLSDILELQKGRDLEVNQCGVPPDEPPWLDHDKFNRGRQFFRDYYYSCFLAMFISLVCGLSVNNLLAALVFTGESNQARKSLIRYIHTFQHVSLWHYGDVWDKSSKAHKSIVTVRNMHNHVATAMNKERASDILYFSQYDMALVQCGFMGVIVMYPEKLLGSGFESQVDDYVHFWRGIGYLLGLNDKFNLCTSGRDKAREKCKAIQEHILVPAIRKPPREFDEMAEALINGANLMPKFKLFSVKSVLAFGLEKMEHPSSQLGWSDTLRVYFLKSLIYLLMKFKAFRVLLNYSLEKGMIPSDML